MSATGPSRGPVAGAEPPAGAIVSATLRICREHWRTLAVYGALAGVPVAALDVATALDRGIDPFVSPLTSDRPAGAGGSLGSTLLALVLYAVASAACVHTVASARDGTAAGWREGLGTGVRRLGGVAAASIVVLLLVVAGLVALVLPGIWIAVALSLTTPALVLERLTPLSAIRRSFTMVQGRWWQTAGVVAFGILIAFAAVVAVAIPAGVLASATDDRTLRAVIAGVTNALSTGVLLPLTVGLVTVLFLERRGAGDSGASGGDASRYGGFAPPVAPGRDTAPDTFGRPADPQRPPAADEPPQRPPAAEDFPPPDRPRG